MATTEEEVRRKAAERQAENAALTSEDPGLLARFGRSIGRSRRENEAKRAATLTERDRVKRVRDLQNEEAKRGFSEGLARFNEGRRAGHTDTAIDTSAFNPGDGTTDKTIKRPDQGGIPFRPLTPEFESEFGQPKPEGADQIDVTDRGQAASLSAAATPNRPDIERPQVLANSNANIVAGGGSKGGRSPLANPDGQFEGGVPEGFLNVIRGTDSSFLRVDDQGRVGDRSTEFRAIPGLGLDDAEAVGARRDPAFRVTTQEDLDRRGLDVQRITAEAQQQNAVANSQFTAINDDGTVEIFHMDENNQPVGTGKSPADLVNDSDEFEMTTVLLPSEFPGGVQEEVTMMKGPGGQLIRVSDQLREELGRAEFDRLQTRDPDATIEELIEEAEINTGGRALPELRQSLGL